MAKNKETQNPIEANTHWQNKKYPNIPIGLEWLESNASPTKKKEIVSLYHYHGHRLKTKEASSTVRFLNGGNFIIYVLLN